MLSIACFTLTLSPSPGGGGGLLFPSGLNAVHEHNVPWNAAGKNAFNAGLLRQTRTWRGNFTKPTPT